MINTKSVAANTPSFPPDREQEQRKDILHQIQLPKLAISGRTIGVWVLFMPLFKAVFKKVFVNPASAPKLFYTKESCLQKALLNIGRVKSKGEVSSCFLRSNLKEQLSLFPKQVVNAYLINLGAR